LYTEAFPQGVSLVLYDLTSVYFEGRGPQGLGAYGFSRDHREDRPQILLAVATDTEGVPIHLEVLRGNRADTTTLHGLLASLKRRFGIQQAIFVFDNGMSSTAQSGNHAQRRSAFCDPAFGSDFARGHCSTTPESAASVVGSHQADRTEP